ncbi:porin [Hydrogenophaga palleronii]|uniref:porin n=1 Tax=Hydrogenophaga palleronii TaxID=65655 RepID=UPI0008252DEE|nr:porin [Hydrogenophaga palleronii]
MTMNKFATAIVLGAACQSHAFAGDSVQVYGSMDGGLRTLTNVNAAGNSRTTMNSSGTYNSNRLGFRGSEDLGGGLKARFMLETGFFGGTGMQAVAAQYWNREATVGLSGPWGSIDAGRQFSVNARTVLGYDPFRFKYLSIVPLARTIIGSSQARFDNDIQYTGRFGPLTVRAERAFGESAGSTATNSATGFGGTYANGPFSVGAAYTKWNDGGGAGFDRTQATLGGTYTSGPMRLSFGIIDDKVQTATVDRVTKNTWLGASYDVLPALVVTGAFYHTKGSANGLSNGRKLLMVGGTYALSRRTNLYLEADRTRLSGTAIVNGQTSQTGVSVGLNHAF